MMINDLQLADKETVEVRNLSGGQKRKLRYYSNYLYLSLYGGLLPHITLQSLVVLVSL